MLTLFLTLCALPAVMAAMAAWQGRDAYLEPLTGRELGEMRFRARLERSNARAAVRRAALERAREAREEEARALGARLDAVVARLVRVDEQWREAA